MQVWAGECTRATRSSRCGRRCQVLVSGDWARGRPGCWRGIRWCAPRSTPAHGALSHIDRQSMEARAALPKPTSELRTDRERSLNIAIARVCDPACLQLFPNRVFHFTGLLIHLIQPPACEKPEQVRLNTYALVPATNINEHDSTRQAGKRYKLVYQVAKVSARRLLLFRLNWCNWCD